MAMIHIINGQLKVVEDFNGKSPNKKDFYLNDELCKLEFDKIQMKLIIKKAETNEVLLELDVK